MKRINKILIISALMLGYLGYQYPLQFDATYNKTNSLTKSNLELLSKVNKPLAVELFTSAQNLNDHVLPIIQLFQQKNKNITFQTHYDAISPQEKSRLRLRTNHNLWLTYDSREKAVDLNPSSFREETFANLIHQILREKEQWVVFLSGHGEQNPFGEENENLNLLTTELKNKGTQIAVLNLGEAGVIPDNTQILVIADSKTSWLPQETTQILKYVNQGGNLLWLINPNAPRPLNTLAESLGIKALHGIILDPKSHTLGTPNLAISLVTQYPEHPITHQLDKLTVFPWATAIQYPNATQLGWKAEPFLTTNASTVIEEAGDKLPGPFSIGITLIKDKQRMVVIGNSHFLSNANIHHYGNLTLINHIFNWLSETDLLVIPSHPAVIDGIFTKSYLTDTVIRYFFPYGLPFLYLWIGWRQGRSRQRRFG